MLRFDDDAPGLRVSLSWVEGGPKFDPPMYEVVRFDIDKAARSFSAQYAPWALRGGEAYDIPWDDIVFASYEFGVGLNRPRCVRWRFNLRSAMEPLIFDLRVEASEDRLFEMDIGMRLANVLDFVSYRVLRGDLRLSRLVFARVPPADGALALPALAEPCDYPNARVAKGVSLPASTLPAFEPARFNGLPVVLEWRPGARVRTAWSADGDLRSLALDAAALAVIGGDWLAMAKDLGEFADHFKLTDRLPLRTTLDWSSKTLALTWPGGPVKAPLDSITKLRVHGKFQSKAQDREAAEQEDDLACYCEVEAVHAAGSFLLALTKPDRDSEVPYFQAASLASELSRALNVPWSWLEYGGG